jgi:hypothetical protein
MHKATLREREYAPGLSGEEHSESRRRVVDIEIDGRRPLRMCAPSLADRLGEPPDAGPFVCCATLEHFSLQLSMI